MDRPRPGKRRHRLIAVATTRDLTTPGTLRIAGSSANVIGSRVALLGDVNGDGIGDLATSGFPFDPNQGNIGRVEVVFGRTSSGRIENRSGTGRRRLPDHRCGLYSRQSCVV